jgi:D-glycero-D-manno-heptose 1,7-bisphosphate phosphatase
VKPDGERGKVIILDRDGTLVIDRGYLADPAGLEFEPFAAEGLRWLYSHHYRLVVITNQSGVGRGFFPLQNVLEMNARLHLMAREIGVTLAGIYFCPHVPEAGCACRKPAPGLMTRAASELGFDPARAVVIGDKETDIEFGRNAGARTILIRANALEDRAQSAADYTVPDLMAAALAVTSMRV